MMRNWPVRNSFALKSLTTTKKLGRKNRLKSSKLQVPSKLLQFMIFYSISRSDYIKRLIGIPEPPDDLRPQVRDFKFYLSVFSTSYLVPLVTLHCLRSGQLVKSTGRQSKYFNFRFTEFIKTQWRKHYKSFQSVSFKFTLFLLFAILVRL
jgi:hypothetical protein